MEKIHLNFELDIGQSGSDDDPFNPLSRALRVPLEEGKPQEGLVLCFYHGENFDESSNPNIRWLGSFVYSSGNRIIFFPGINNPPDWTQHASSKTLNNKVSFKLDHISMEPSRKRWHFTTPGSHHHRRGGMTRDLGEGRQNWVGLSISTENELRIVRNNTTASFSCPPSDANRRIEHLSELYSNAPHHSVGLLESSKERFEKGFLHISFIALPKEAPVYKGPSWLPPVGSPFLDAQTPMKISKLQMRWHRVYLPGDYDIQLTLMWLPGLLNVPALWTTYTNP